MNLSIPDSDLNRLFVRLVCPILAVIAMLAGLNLWFKLNGIPPHDFYWGKSFDEYDVIVTNAVKAKNKGKRVVAFIGDSRIEWGIDPNSIQRAIEKHVENVEVFNLGLPGRNVRNILTRLNEAGFYPDVLVVGYSHLSFYWSKFFVPRAPRVLAWWESDLNRFHSFVRRKIIGSSFISNEIWPAIRGIAPAPRGSWLDSVGVTPRGQARVHYRIPQEEAVAFQKAFYKSMYSVPMSDEAMKEANSSFLEELAIQREHGTKVLLLKMPLSDWALELERAYERSTLADLANYLKTPFVDGNEAPGATKMASFDGLHLTPSAAELFGPWVAQNLILPNWK